MKARFDFSRGRASQFLDACHVDNDIFRLAPQAEPTAYARCFAVFLLKLLRRVPDNPLRLARSLVEDMHALRERSNVDTKSKSYRQLLAFSLSANAALGVLGDECYADLVAEQIPLDVERELNEFGCLTGKAGSGNQAMFLAIFLIHGRDSLGLDTQSHIDDWVNLHINHMNRFGFWGSDRGITHLQFQNGYHQHEIFDYLEVENPRLEEMIAAVRSLADIRGHFAPYPGGGGCYDYDAVFLLTPGNRPPDAATYELLLRTANSISSEQNADGGFCESHYVRPRTFQSYSNFVRHVVSAWKHPAAMKERLRYGVTLQRQKHDRVHTHWTRYSRHWDESDLWDTWFRMLTLARIDVAMNPDKASEWGFIGYPGIGFHHSLRVAAVDK